MLANEMKTLSKVSRNLNEEFNKQWEEMKNKIKEYANKGENKCTLVYGKYNELLIEKLKENGFRVAMAYEIFPNVFYGMRGSATKWVMW